MGTFLALIYNSQVGLALLATLCTLLVSPFFMVYCIYQGIWQCLVTLFWPDVRCVSLNDEIWFHVLKNFATVNSLIEFEGIIDISTAQTLIAERLIQGDSELHFKFYSRIERRLGRCVWAREENFDIRDHVQVYSVEHRRISEANLPSVVSELCNTQLYQLDKALWHIQVIYTETGNTVWLFQMHHIISDGVALVQMLRNSFFDKEIANGGIETLQRIRHHNSNSGAYQSLPSGPRTLMKLFSLGNKSGLFSSRNHEGQTVAWSRGFDFQVMRSLKLRTDSTINDIFISSVAGAFLRYFRDEIYEDAVKKLPSDLRVYIPVNMRSEERNGKQEPIQNHISLVYITLPLLIEDARKRLEVIKQRLIGVKNSIQPMLIYLLMNYLIPRMPLSLATQLSQWGTYGDAILVSNLAGPPTKVSVGGYKIEKMMFWPPSGKFIGIRISMLTYNSQVFFGAMCDTSVVHNPEKLINSIEKVLRDFEDEVIPL